MATAMNSPDTIIPLVQQRTNETEGQVWSSVSIEEVYEIDRCVTWIQKSQIQRVALQFPDSLLCDAPRVCNLIQQKLGREVFILGDTSYGECCVDEVAASHLFADGVVHFGHTCLTPTENLPVLYIFTKRECGKEKLKDKLKEKWRTDGKSVLLIYDVEYDHELKNLDKEITGVHLIIGQCSSENKRGVKKFGRYFDVESAQSLSICDVIYIGKGGHILLNLMYNLPSCNFYVYENFIIDPAGVAVSKLIMKRHFLIEKTKDAERIGLLVGTLGTANYSDILERLRSTIKNAGKKVYTFLVGKPNVAKLANFPEIDVFVFVACSETSIFDSKDYFKPIITPYELELACNKQQEWCGSIATDFHDLLKGGEKHKEIVRQEDNDDEPCDISLVTGKIRNIGINNASESGELAVINDKTVSILHAGGGGEFLASRSWNGLEQHLGQTEVSSVVQGKRGIATKYEGEEG